MGIVLGVTGFAGVGKSTAVEYLVEAYGMRRVYLGGYVLDEVRRRGLPSTRDSERLVRRDLRSVDRSAVMRLGMPSVLEALGDGLSVVVDAVLLPEDLEALRSAVGSDRLHVAMIVSPLEARCARLAQRVDRPFSRDDILTRDQDENGDLRIDLVFAAARHRLSNDGTIECFREVLDGWASEVGLPISGSRAADGRSGTG